MAHFEKLMKVNIADAVQAMGLKMSYSGKVNIPYHLELDNAWIEQGACPNRECLLWKDIIFEKFNIIHPGCVSCWKTFYRPKNLKELYEIYELQKRNAEHGIVPSCKCGIETRPYVGGLGGYGAFWYNSLGCGLDQARENTKQLSEVYGKELQLKRGCTEMEQFTIGRLGMDSTKWNDLIEIAKEKLSILELTFEVDTEYRRHPRPLALRIKTETRWIRWAAEHGDLTYLDFVDQALIPSLHIYTKSIDRGRDIDDGAIWNHYRRYGANDERVGGTHGKQEKALIAEL